MKTHARDTRWALGLLAILVLITIAAAIAQTRQAARQIPLSPLSTNPDGARALWLWLEESGYTLSQQTSATFEIFPETSVLLILQPRVFISDQEWAQIEAWIASGGTLVLAGEQPEAHFAFGHFGFTLKNLPAESPGPVTPQTPFWHSPPLTGPVTPNPDTYFAATRARRNGNGTYPPYTTHLAVGTYPILISMPIEQGLVILSSSAYPFTNAGLKETGNPALALNMVTAAESLGTIQFDEWHHGQRSTEQTVAGPGDWLRHTPAGRSILYSVIVIFIALVLGGRRFGRPVPPPQNNRRRAPLEHITAMANLNRRAHHRTWVLRYHYHLLKRQLGKRYRLDPTLPDSDYITQLAQYDPTLDQQALHKLLSDLQKVNVTESEMIQLTNQVTTWLKETP